jgi:hypothetical protein
MSMDIHIVLHSKKKGKIREQYKLKYPQPQKISVVVKNPEISLLISLIVVLPLISIYLYKLSN